MLNIEACRRVLLASATDEQAEGVHLRGRWGELPLISAGQLNATTARQFPNTIKILHSLPVEFINARISVVAPGLTLTLTLSMQGLVLLPQA